VAAGGVARVEAGRAGLEDVAQIVLRLQRELFVLNAELATGPSEIGRLEPGVSLVTAQMVDALERTIDELTGAFEQPKDFIVPGNSPAGAALDFAARVVRRAERAIDALARVEDVRGEARAYVNRPGDRAW